MWRSDGVVVGVGVGGVAVAGVVIAAARDDANIANARARTHTRRVFTSNNIQTGARGRAEVFPEIDYTLLHASSNTHSHTCQNTINYRTIPIQRWLKPIIYICRNTYARSSAANAPKIGEVTPAHPAATHEMNSTATQIQSTAPYNRLYLYSARTRASASARSSSQLCLLDLTPLYIYCKSTRVHAQRSPYAINQRSTCGQPANSVLAAIEMVTHKHARTGKTHRANTKLVRFICEPHSAPSRACVPTCVRAERMDGFALYPHRRPRHPDSPGIKSQRVFVRAKQIQCTVNVFSICASVSLYRISSAVCSPSSDGDPSLARNVLYAPRSIIEVYSIPMRTTAWRNLSQLHNWRDNKIIICNHIC